MLVNRRNVLSGIAASPIAAAIGSAQPVTIFEATRILTMERGFPSARYMAVSGGIILGLADSFEALAPWTKGRKITRDRRFADKVIFPGLIDPHIHPMQAAIMLAIPFLAPDDWHLPSGHWPGVTGQADYRARLKQIVEQTPGDPLIIWGHHELFHGPMDRTLLDNIAPYRPLFVWQRSFHDIYANTAALRWMKLDSADAFTSALAAAKADPAHSSFERGMFSETGLSVAIAKLQPVLLAPERLSAGMAGLLHMMRQRGVTTTSDLATGIFASFDREADLIAKAFGSSHSNARVNLMPMATALDQITDLDGWMADRVARFSGPQVSLKRRVKLFADGAFFAQNMRMGPPGYSDGHIGKWLTEPEALHRQMRRYGDAAFAMHIHVNGDEGAQVVLDGLAALPKDSRKEIVLEHLGYCSEAQITRIARMGLMVSAQPNYIRVLGEAYSREGLGPDRAALMNRLGSLERGGVPLGLHSDFNMAPIDPFYLAWIAQTREGIDGTERAPKERLSREKALRAITIEAAQVIGMDRDIGSLAAGKKADFIVLDDDPFALDIAALKDIPIRATFFEGRSG